MLEMNCLFFPDKIRELNIKEAGLISNPRIKDKWVKYENQLINHSEKHKEYVEMLFDIINFTELSNKSLKILDVGCGFGADIIELSNQGLECVGLDAVQDYSNFITELGKTFGLKIRGDFGDACNLPYESASFDVVMSQSFFEHLKDFDLGMNEQIRVLKTGGKLIAIDGNFLCPPTLFDLLFKYPVRTHGKYGGIKWLFTKGKVRENLYESGGWIGKDEDIHTIFWWKRKMRNYPSLKIIQATTTRAYRAREKWFSKILHPYLGSILIVAVKN